MRPTTTKKQRPSAPVLAMLVSSLSLLFTLHCSDDDDYAKEEPPTAASCATATTESECRAIDGCNTITGWKADSSRECFDPAAHFIYCEVSVGCEFAYTHALDPTTGECYLFSNTCLAPGWTRIDSVYSHCAAYQFEFCPETEEEADETDDAQDAGPRDGGA